jgi:hypothetical protein
MMTINEPYNGKRGLDGTYGWWISCEEARDRSIGNEEWWKEEGIGGRTVTLKQYAQHPAPADKPIWLYNNGDMYLGEWAVGRTNFFLENGFGATYNNNPGKCKGKIYIGEWKSGECHGSGKSLWLKSSNTWINNKFPASEIKQKEGEKNVSRPYVYIGDYADGIKNDANAMVTLKDGTTRAGPWEKGKPVGDWWSEEDHPLTATLTAASCGVASSLSEPRASKRTRTERSQNRATRSATESPDTKPPARIETNLKKQTTTGVEKPKSPTKKTKQVEKPKKTTPKRKRAKFTETKGPTNGAPKSPTNGTQKVNEPKSPAKKTQKVETLKRKTRSNSNAEVPISPAGDAELKASDGAETETDGAETPMLAAARPVRITKDHPLAATETVASCGVASSVLESGADTKPPARIATLNVAPDRKSVASIVPQAPLVIPIDSVDPDAVFSPGQAVSTSDEEREKEISEWLMKVIGFNPNLKQMESYARSFIGLGLHSVEMIIAHCTAHDVAEFSWMLKFHKRGFLSGANLKED